MQTNNKRLIRALYPALILACIPPGAFAGDPQNCRNEKMPPMHHSMMLLPDGMQPPLPFDRLNLSESQQMQIDNLLQAQMRAIIEKQRLIRKTILALHETSAADEFDAVRAKLLADAHGRAVGELVFLHAEMQAKVAAVLTEAQRKQMHGGCR